MSEIWRPVLGFEGWYEVSGQGRVKRVMPGRGAIAPRILKGRPNKKGYISVVLHLVSPTGRLIRSCPVHHLVAESFIGIRPTPKHQTNHKNGHKDDNRPDNLEWVTNDENMRHSWEMGLRNYIGKNNHTAKLTEQDVREIIDLKGKIRQPDLAKRYGVGLNQIKGIHRGITWKHITTQPEIAAQLATAPINTRKGQPNNNAKLTVAQVIEIKRLLPTHTNRQLADIYGMSIDTIRCIRKGRLWPSVQP